MRMEHVRVMVLWLLAVGASVARAQARCAPITLGNQAVALVRYLGP